MRLSGDTLRRLAREHGESFFLLDVGRFQRSFDAFRDALRAIHPNSTLGYSYKTNYLPPLCRAVEERGGYAEVVSRLEYDLARRLGVPPHHIIFNGPLKREADLELALCEGALVNLDGPRELATVETLARRHPSRPFTLGLRCNLALRGAEASRFGFDAETGDLDRAAETLRRLPNCTLAGLHAHSSASRDVASYGERIRRLISLADKLFPEAPPRFLDVGGGFFGSMPEALQARFGGATPSFEDYAGAIAPAIVERYGRQGAPELIVEPGVALAGDAMRFVARIVDLKTVGGRRVAQCTGSVQIVKPTLHPANMPLEVVHGDAPADADAGPTDIMGYTCMENDCLHRGYDGPLSPGDFAVFGNVGAYTLVFKPPFIQPAPPVLAVGDDPGRFEVVRRRETLDDVFATCGFEAAPSPRP